METRGLWIDDQESPLIFYMVKNSKRKQVRISLHLTVSSYGIANGFSIRNLIYHSSVRRHGITKYEVENENGIDFDLSFLITVVSVIKLRLIWQPSLSLAPSACVCEARSLPARSTKFCRTLM